MPLNSIFFTIGSLSLGGAESQMCLMIRELTKRGWHCELFVLDATGPLRERLQIDGITIHDAGYGTDTPKWQKVVQLIRALIRLTFLLRKKKPAAIHSYLPLTNFIGSLAGRLSGTKLIITSHRALGTHKDLRWYWGPVDRISNALSHRVTANSKAVAQDTIIRDKINQKKLAVIYNGVEFRRFESAQQRREGMRAQLGVAENVIGVLLVGNLISYKGHADLIRAVPLVNRDSQTVRYFIAGEDRGVGPDLVRLTNELGVADQIEFLGRRSDIPEIMAAMDVFVMPSHEEGFSNALLEAMASGLAIAATCVGGNPEALDQGRFGVLVPPHDPSALAKAIQQLISNEAYRAKLGERAKTAVKNRYTVEAMVAQHISLYGCQTSTE